MPRFTSTEIKFSDIQSFFGLPTANAGSLRGLYGDAPFAGPVSISSLKSRNAPPVPSAWYDAVSSSMTRDGNNRVSQWNDKTANAYHVTQATSANQPQYSATGFDGTRPCVLFNTTTAALSRALSSMGTLGTSGALTCYVISEADTNPWNITATMWFTSAGAGTTANRFHFSLKDNATYVTSIYNPSTKVTGQTTVSGSKYMNGFIWGGANVPSYLLLNNTVFRFIALASFPTAPADQAFMMGDVRSGSNRTPKLAEVIMYPRAISVIERLNIEQYLMEKWKLLPLDQLSSSALTNLRGAFATTRLLTSYTGPIIRVRRSSDNTEIDVYADMYGNMSTGYNGSDAALREWLGEDVAYITTWYDQSGNGRHATQTTTSAQPVFNPCNCSLDFQNSSAQFLNMPSGTVPVGTLNAQYTFVFRHRAVNNMTTGGIIGSGTNATTNATNNVRLNNTNYINYWWGNDYSFGTASANGNTVSVRYDGTNRIGYVNGVAGTATASSGYTNGAGQQFIGKTTNNEHLNGQLFYVCIFGSALADADRLIAENNLNVSYHEAILNHYSSYQRYDANSIPTATTNVSTWVSTHNDGSTGVNATGAGTSLPTYQVVNTFPEVVFGRTNNPHFTIASLAYTWWGTNGGVTFVIVVRFASAGSWERIFDFGAGQGNNNIILARNAGTTTLTSDVYNSTTAFGYTSTANGIPDTNYHVYAMTVGISASGTTVTHYIDGVAYATTTNATLLATRTTTSNFLGRSNWADAYLSGAMREFIVYKSALSATDVNAVTSALQTKWGLAQRFPPSSLSSGGTGLTGSVTLAEFAHGNGTYTFAASSQNSASAQVPSLAFDLNTTSPNVWTSSGNYNASGAYNNANSTVVDGVTEFGEWLQIRLPYRIRARQVYLFEESTRNATSMVIAASNDGTTWTSLYSATGLATGTTNIRYIQVSPTITYQFYRYIARAINPAGNPNHTLREFAIYGDNTRIVQTYTYNTGNVSYPGTITNPVGQWGTYYWGTFTVSGVPSGLTPKTASLTISWSKQSSSFGSYIFGHLVRNSDNSVIFQTSMAGNGPFQTEQLSNTISNVDISTSGIANGSVLKFAISVWSGSTFQNIFASTSLVFG